MILVRVTARCCRQLLAHHAPVTVEEITTDDGVMSILVKTTIVGAMCPGCGTVSERRHGGYRRRLADLAVAGRRTVIDLLVSRFACTSVGCARRTFVEQVRV